MNKIDINTRRYNDLLAEGIFSSKKVVFIARLELTVAVLSIKLSTMLRRELTIHPTIREYIWTDSEAVLGYVNYNAKCYKIFVTNTINPGECGC